MKSTERAVAPQIESLFRTLTGRPLPFGVHAWDGSQAGPTGGPVVVLRDRAILRRLLWHPSWLGLAQAYIAGEAGIDGDLVGALDGILGSAPAVSAKRLALTAPSALGFVVRQGGIGRRPAAPADPARLSGRLHSRDRDRAVIAHHYDLSNQFYATILDPSMAYSCGYWTSVSADYGLADAQRDKAELVCGKLELKAGRRLLDLGCGWGSLSLHAALHYGVSVTAVTLSSQQHRFVTGRVADLGLEHLVDVRLQDYRDVADGPYDAVAAIEIGEHVGAGAYPRFLQSLYGLLAADGRMLIQQMSRGRRAPGGGAFVGTYIAPDMYMRPVAETAGLVRASGFQVLGIEDLRAHYCRTVLAWLDRLHQNWPSLVDIVGEPTVRVWQLYLAGGALAFRDGRMGVEQILAVRAAVPAYPVRAVTR